MSADEQNYEDLRAGHHVAHIREWHHEQYRQLVERRRAAAEATIRRRRAA